MRRKIRSVKVLDTQKRRVPTKHYVYTVKVTWDDGSETLVYRRYSLFFDLQVSLLESFPVEGGIKDPELRTIPFLPGKILFRRSHIREVAIKRLKPIDEYCAGLIKLPATISESELVLDFFESTPEDINPLLGYFKKPEDVKDIGEISGPIHLDRYEALEDYERTEPKELSVSSGQVVEVIEKQENGWWFVTDDEGECGWVPGAFLRRLDGTEDYLTQNEASLGKGESYITTAAYTGGAGEVSFISGVIVEVLQKNLEGWWKISYGGKQGLAPASYLELLGSEHQLSDFDHRTSSSVGGASVAGGSAAAGNRYSLDASSLNHVGTPPVPRSDLRKTRSSLTRHSSDVNPNTYGVSRRVTRGTVRKIPPKLGGGGSIRKPKAAPPLPPPVNSTSSFDDEPVYEYVTVASFNSNVSHGVDLIKDKVVKVVEKSPGDWWYINIEGKEGWAPASHIQKQLVNKSAKIPTPTPPPPAVLRPVKPPSVKKPITEKKVVDGELFNKFNRFNNNKVDTNGKPQAVRPSEAPQRNNIQPKEQRFGGVALRKSGNSKILNTTTSNGFRPALPVKTATTTTKNGGGGSGGVAGKKATAVGQLTKQFQGLNNNGAPSVATKPSKPSLPAKTFTPKPFTPAAPKPFNKPLVANKPLLPKAKPSPVRKPFVGRSDVTKPKPLNSMFMKAFESSSDDAGVKPSLPPKKTAFSPARPAVNRPPQLPKKPPQPTRPKPVDRFKFAGGGNINNSSSSDFSSSSSSSGVDYAKVQLPRRESPDGEVGLSRFNDNSTTAPSGGKNGGGGKLVAVHQYEAASSTEVTVRVGDVVWSTGDGGGDHDNPNWVFVETNSGSSGWAPRDYFKPNDDVTDEVYSEAALGGEDDIYSEIADDTPKDVYYVVYDIKIPSHDTALKVNAGDSVLVLEAATDDWWFARIVTSSKGGDRVGVEGWIPPSYLAKNP